MDASSRSDRRKTSAEDMSVLGNAPLTAVFKCVGDLNVQTGCLLMPI